MNKITWKYVKPLHDQTVIDAFEKRAGVLFPDDLKQIMQTFNGGRPSLKYYDLYGERNKEFKTLLSFNETDVENIFKVYNRLETSDGALIPFASDSSGNYFVLKNGDGNIYLWRHETDTTVLVAESFSVFLDMLHS